MPTERDLMELIKRLEKASGPDRALDEAVMAVFYVRDKRHIGVTEGWDDEPDSYLPVKSDVWVDPATDKWVSTHAHPFTASLDAAVALVERVLPGWVWHASSDGPHARVQDRPGLLFARQVFEGKGSTPAAALVLALLRAVQAQREAGE